MATWQELYGMLLDENLSPEQIVARLNVRPSRLRRLLASKRLAARLNAVESVADRRGVHALISRIGQAAGRLVKLVESERPETARKACLDVIGTARQVHKSRADAEQRDWLNRVQPSRCASTFRLGCSTIVIPTTSSARSPARTRRSRMKW